MMGPTTYVREGAHIYYIPRAQIYNIFTNCWCVKILLVLIYLLITNRHLGYFCYEKVVNVAYLI